MDEMDKMVKILILKDVELLIVLISVPIVAIIVMERDDVGIVVLKRYSIKI